MNAPTEKDYIDSKLQTVIERLNGEARGHQIASDAHPGNFQRDLQAFRVEFNERISQLEASIHRSLIDAVKWMIGTMIALTAISITVSSTLFLRLAPKEEILQRLQQPPCPVLNLTCLQAARKRCPPI